MKFAVRLASLSECLSEQFRDHAVTTPDLVASHETVIMPLTRHFVEPTPGLEPGTCRLQVAPGACRPMLPDTKHQHYPRSTA